VAGPVMIRGWIVAMIVAASSGCATHNYRCNDRLRPVNAAPVSRAGLAVPEAPK
jgi:hypothetical protein